MLFNYNIRSKIEIYTDHKSLLVSFKIPILYYYGDLCLKSMIQRYNISMVSKNIVADDALSQFTNNGNQETTQESNHITKFKSEIDDIDEISEGISPVNLIIMD